MPERPLLIVGAGFTGAVLARQIADHTSRRIVVIDQRNHVAGNCHTERDPATGILIHVYGPHIFNTNRLDVWSYVNKFGAFGPYINRVKAHTPRGIFSFPINLHTINQFFNRTFNPAEAAAFVADLGEKSIGEPANFEEQALKLVGRELYETFFLGYTVKQWGCEPRELPAAILKRLPIRFNYDDRYYNSVYQGIPIEGYTSLIEKILDHPRIEVRLNTSFDPSSRDAFGHTFYSGPIDAFYNFRLGRLGYRTVTFERIDASGDFQGNAVINFPDRAPAWTRIHEHKHFAPWESHDRTVAFREFSKETGPQDPAYYPKRLAADRALLSAYRDLASREAAISFVGRLGTYRYLDMDKVVGEALDFSNLWLTAVAEGKAPPTFPNSES